MLQIVGVTHSLFKQFNVSVNVVVLFLTGTVESTSADPYGSVEMFISSGQSVGKFYSWLVCC